MTDHFLRHIRVGKKTSIYMTKHSQTWYDVCWACLPGVDWKCRTWKWGTKKDETLENAGPENAGPNVTTWKGPAFSGSDIWSSIFRSAFSGPPFSAPPPTSSWYCRRTAGYPHHHCYRGITQPSSSATGGVREAPVAWPAFCWSKSLVFVTVERGRTTSSKVTSILACVGEFKLAIRTCSTF